MLVANIMLHTAGIDFIDWCSRTAASRTAPIVAWKYTKATSFAFGLWKQSFHRLFFYTLGKFNFVKGIKYK
ncbi:hypothetical protein JOC33_003162 [Thalassobacillus pellis]|nr:hypothetical protein [Thalassobacillus pellis]